MSRVDLDALQHYLYADRTLDDFPQYEAVRQAVAELLVARDVVDAARKIPGPAGGKHRPELIRPLAAYDEVVGS